MTYVHFKKIYRHPINQKSKNIIYKKIYIYNENIKLYRAKFIRIETLNCIMFV